MRPTRRFRRRQAGGDYKYSGAQIAGNGAPIGAVVDVASPHCQSGGGCGCMIPAPQNGGGGGFGGYTVDVGSHDLGKVGVVVPGSCQKGGDLAKFNDYPSMAGGPSAVSVHEMATHGAGYSNGPAVLSPSAAFNLVQPYNAKGGRSRLPIIRITKNRKASRKNRQSRQRR